MEDFLKKILKKIKPSEKERKEAEKAINEVKRIFEENNIEIFVGGSFGKDTWLSGDYDIDLFALFEKEDRISDKVEEVLKKNNLNYLRVKGSRDYFKLFYNKYEFEIVPILKIKDISEAKNVTDFSPFHVKYVLDHTDEEMRDNIRLLKAFMKANNIYGAESYIKGFSGYSAELLIIYYKNFMNLIQSSINWKPKLFIDIGGYYKDVKEAIKNLGKDKSKSPIILIDPVNKYRNALASLSTQKFSEFIFSSYKFLKDEDKEKYFIRKIKKEEEMIERAKKYNVNLLIVEGEGKGESKDIKNTKLLKFFQFLINQIEINGFYVLNYYIEFEKEKGYLYIFFYPKKLPNYEIRKGPIVWYKKSFEEFYEKHKNEELFIRNSRIYSISERKYKEINDIIKNIFVKYKESIEDKVEKFNYKLL